MTISGRFKAAGVLLGLLWGADVLAAAEATFSGSLRADEFSSAGLEKLTPAERVRLDALVRSYQQGTLEAARSEAAAARAAKTAAEERAAKAEAAALADKINKRVKELKASATPDAIELLIKLAQLAG